jgi:hypothetical protein
MTTTLVTLPFSLHNLLKPEPLQHTTLVLSRPAQPYRQVQDGLAGLNADIFRQYNAK